MGSTDFDAATDRSAATPSAAPTAERRAHPSPWGQAILFADLRGFTSYTRERGDEQAYRLAKAFTTLAVRSLDQHCGRAVKTLGDGIMAAFLQPADAVRCAREIQEEIARRNAAHPDDALTSGIGVAWGTPIEEDGDLFGSVVNLAQRLSDHARGGQILVSPAVVERMSGQGLRYIHLGTQDPKGLGYQEIYEHIWRDEVDRITTNEGRLNLILTKDALVVELGKSLQEQIQLVRKLLSDRAPRRRSIRGFVANKTLGLLERGIPRLVDRAIFRAGIGLEHPLADVTASFERNTLTVRIRGHHGVRLGPRDVDPRLAAEFVAKLTQLKTAGLTPS